MHKILLSRTKKFLFGDFPKGIWRKGRVVKRQLSEKLKKKLELRLK